MSEVASPRGAEVAAPRVAVVIASLGRPDELQELLQRLQHQTLPPAFTVLSVTGPGDLPRRLPKEVEVVTGSKGLPAQRNRGMEVALRRGCDVIVFFDDDFVPTLDALELYAGVFAKHPEVAGVTGLVIADGIRGPGISQTEALEILARHDTGGARSAACAPTLGLYGCNMAIRASAIGDERFDERLPLYAWQEDIDFSRRLLPRGGLVRTETGAGVHRGVKGARTSGYAFGWSQVVNPVYMVRKGTMPWRYAARLIVRNMAANHLRALAPEPWVDRRGRLAGNWAALLQIAGGRIDPSLMPGQGADRADIRE